MSELEKLKDLIRQLHAAKGRYNTQLAVCALYDALGLPNIKPEKGGGHER